MEEDQNTPQVPAQEPAAPISSAEPIERATSIVPKGKNNTGILILCILMLVGLIVLYVLHFAGNGTAHRVPASAVADTTQGLTVAYVNTDTLMAKYQYALDLQKKIESLQAQKTSEYKGKVQKFQSDAQSFQNEYQNYLKTGDQLTLSQQQTKEKLLTNTQSNLQERQAQLSNLESQMAQQLQLQTMAESEKMTKAVYAFIRDYNEKYLHYDLILSKSFNSSPVLYGKPTLDITNVIVEELNKEYAGLDKEEAKMAKQDKSIKEGKASKKK